MGDNMSLDLRKKIKKIFYEIARKEMLKNITCDLGEIIEEKDKFICKVSQNKLNKMYAKDKFLTLNLSGVNPDSKEYVNYKLDKPIYYVFDKIIFTNGLRFYSVFNSNVIFRECDFRKNIYIFGASGEVIFDSNLYCNQSSHEYDETLFKSKYDRKTETKEMLYGRRINKIVFNTEWFKNNKKGAHPGHYGMDIEAKKVEISNSEIEIKSPGVCFIKSNNLKLDDSCIRCNELFIDSEMIESIDSRIVTQNACIDNPNNDLIKNVYANTLIYNNILLKDDDLLDNEKQVASSEALDIDEELIERKKIKIEILERLKSLKEKCEDIKREELKNKEQELNTKEIAKILRK